MKLSEDNFFIWLFFPVTVFVAAEVSKDGSKISSSPHRGKRLNARRLGQHTALNTKGLCGLCVVALKINLVTTNLLDSISLSEDFF